ncbi:MAG: zinc ribbon domain-containing protein [Verrucomicrobia bacterium]|nr:zinc ribbon domain-containing protein [Verrucomicrobiota bacterium]
MATYVYETIPAAPEEQPVQFEVRQSMNDAPLTRHPETGQPVRRVIVGGYGLLKKDGGSGSGASCGTGCGCHN